MNTKELANTMNTEEFGGTKETSNGAELNLGLKGCKCSFVDKNGQEFEGVIRGTFLSNGFPNVVVESENRLYVTGYRRVVLQRRKNDHRT